MSDGKASPGKKFAVPPAEIWNGMVDAGAAYRAGRLSIGDPGPTRPRETDIIRLRNGGSTARQRGEIMLVVRNFKAITDLSDESIWLDGAEPTANGHFAILKEPIDINAVGRAQVSGCCLALVNITDTNHQRARSVLGNYVLQSSAEGPIDILYAPSGTGEKECAVRFGGSGGGGRPVAFELTSNWSSFIATCDIIAPADLVATGVSISDSLGVFGITGIGDRGYAFPSNFGLTGYNNLAAFQMLCPV
jgi:hypothetical protein